MVSGLLGAGPGEGMVEVAVIGCGTWYLLVGILARLSVVVGIGT
jgi:hypothetical protein